MESVRRDQFAEFAKAVQVGLLDYQGPQGVKALFSLMKSRYGKVTLLLRDCCSHCFWPSVLSIQEVRMPFDARLV